jgi:hypothetical protein
MQNIYQKIITELLAQPQESEIEVLKKYQKLIERNFIETLRYQSTNLEIAIIGYQAALTIYLPTVNLQNWATIKVNLANTYRDRILGNRQTNLELAIANYF